MCLDCAIKRVAELISLQEAAGLTRQNGKVAVCMAGHRDHSHLRFRDATGAFSEWYYVNANADDLLTALNRARCAVHEHPPWEAGIDDAAAAALEQGRAVFERVLIDDTCPICFEGFEEGDDTIAMPCGHALHRGCSGRWFQRSNRCPTCRFELTAEAIGVAEEKVEQFEGNARSGWASYLRTDEIGVRTSRRVRGARAVEGSS
jgi:hypothetical protein